MRLSKIILIVAIVLQVGNSSLSAKELKKPITINFQDLTISNLIKITAKILNKNILQTTKIEGKVDFISNT